MPSSHRLPEHHPCLVQPLTMEHTLAQNLPNERKFSWRTTATGMLCTAGSSDDDCPTHEAPVEDKSSHAWAEPAGSRASPTATSWQEQGAALPLTQLPGHSSGTTSHCSQGQQHQTSEVYGTVLALARLQVSKSPSLKAGLALKFASSTSDCCRLSPEQGLGWSVEAPGDICIHSQQRPCQTLYSESEMRPEGLSSYQQGGGDGKGAGSDARDEVQQVISWDGTRGVREIPQDLQSQEGEAWCPQKAPCLPSGCQRLSHTAVPRCPQPKAPYGAPQSTNHPVPLPSAPHPEQHRAHPIAHKDLELVLTAGGNPWIQKVGEVD